MAGASGGRGSSGGADRHEHRLTRAVCAPILVVFLPSSSPPAAARAVAGNEARLSALPQPPPSESQVLPSLPHSPVPKANKLPGLAAAAAPGDETASPSPPRAASGGDADGECVVCLERQAQVAVIPCGHVCLCAECAQQQGLCPICRSHICGRLRLFFSASR